MITVISRSDDIVIRTLMQGEWQHSFTRRQVESMLIYLEGRSRYRIIGAIPQEIREGLK